MPGAPSLAAAAAPAGAGLGRRRPLRRRQPRHVRSSHSARALLPARAPLAYTVTADDRLTAMAGRCSTRCWSLRSGRPRRPSQRRRPGCRQVVRRAGPMRPPASSRLDWRGERSTPRCPSASPRDNDEGPVPSGSIDGGEGQQLACVCLEASKETLSVSVSRNALFSSSTDMVLQGVTARWCGAKGEGFGLLACGGLLQAAVQGRREAPALAARRPRRYSVLNHRKTPKRTLPGFFLPELLLPTRKLGDSRIYPPGARRQPSTHRRSRPGRGRLRSHLLPPRPAVPSL